MDIPNKRDHLYTRRIHGNLRRYGKFLGYKGLPTDDEE
jgi:hypothetical protein